MNQQAPCNLSPCVNLDTARFLTDAQLLQEYERLQNAGYQPESTLDRLWRNPKFRLKVLRWTRLGIFTVLVWAGISTISSLRLWNDIYAVLITAL